MASVTCRALILTALAARLLTGVGAAFLLLLLLQASASEGSSISMRSSGPYTWRRS
jgi:hypothetical protein